MASPLGPCALVCCSCGGMRLECSLEFGRSSFFTHRNLILLSLGRLNTIAISSIKMGFILYMHFMEEAGEKSGQLV